MAKRKKDTENTSVVQNDAITEAEDVCKATEQANEVSDTIQTEAVGDTREQMQSDYVIEMRHITKEFPGIVCKRRPLRCNSNAAKSMHYSAKTAQASPRLCPFFSDCINPKKARF